jgi:hypothetical protein
MSVKTQQKVLTALLQFSYGMKARQTALLSGLNPASNLDSLSSVLFRRNQNPSTFIFKMLSLAPNLDENFLVESFLIITNKKISLLQDIAMLLQSPFFIPYLSRADFILSKSIVEIGNLTETSTPSNMTRTKRSTWGNFWSSVWGSATQEQLQNVYKTEAETAQQELEMQSVVSEVVKNSALAQNSLKGVTQTQGTLKHEQQNLLTEISDILVKEKQGITAVSGLAQA